MPGNKSDRSQKLPVRSHSCSFIFSVQDGSKAAKMASHSGLATFAWWRDASRRATFAIQTESFTALRSEMSVMLISSASSSVR